MLLRSAYRGVLAGSSRTTRVRSSRRRGSVEAIHGSAERWSIRAAPRLLPARRRETPCDASRAASAREDQSAASDRPTTAARSGLLWPPGSGAGSPGTNGEAWRKPIPTEELIAPLPIEEHGHTLLAPPPSLATAHRRSASPPAPRDQGELLEVAQGLLGCWLDGVMSSTPARSATACDSPLIPLEARKAGRKGVPGVVAGELCASITTVDESMPPLSDVPTGTSLRRRSRIESPSSPRSSATASP